MGALDRSLGLVFGLLRGFVIASLIWLGFSWVIPKDDQPEWVQEARTVPALNWGGHLLVALAPEDLLQEGGEAADDAVENLRQLQENKETFERLQNAVSKDSESSSQDGYNQGDRLELESLIDQVGESGEATE